MFEMDMWRRANITLALDSLAANRLRTALTITVIAIGITSLVGIETAMDILSEEVSGSFGRMGAGSIAITSSPSGESRPITLHEAESFVAQWSGNSACLSAELLQMAEVSSEGKHTDPVVKIVAADRNFVETARLSLAEGRNFSKREVQISSNVCILGHAVAAKLFKHRSPIGHTVTAAGASLRVAGILERQGALLGEGYDNSLIIPIAAARGKFISGSTDFRILIPCDAHSDISAVENEARSAMRAARRLPAGHQCDFDVSSSDALQQKFSSIKHKLSIAALIVGLITLLGASVGLMNILLVSVKERTAEIGLRKAIGERVSSIRRQFLLEAVIIGQAGGAIGIIVGLLTGNAVALWLESSFIIPWVWIFRAVAICLAVSLASGSIPASRAAALNPVDSLRR